jgi:uncharacterized protein YaiE (UPF0345 family)
MEIIAGNLEAQLPQSSEWCSFTSGDSFEVMANSKFKLVVKEITDYCCSYLNE